MYKTVIFDVDGTLLDTERVVLHALQVALGNAGLDYELADLRFALGITGAKALAQLGVENQESVMADWFAMEAKLTEDVEIFDGIVEVLEKLDGIGVVTSKNADEMETGFYPFNLAERFDAIVCASDTENHKPHPDPLLRCMAMLGADPATTLYVGDATYDMECAHAAGANFALALWGAKTTDGFERANHVLETPSDVLKYVRR
ncbi:HAD family hydrolase [Listeria booriae]|uniref:HAD family hydrolase n=1 Tax=Listeria booriae TaxID=1552123 RepID=A0A841XYP1_9LIST|nr:HAD family hydrolase [Listeria booriae]MBC1316738.1 HAD family hydrolase [Listeria booriae]